MNLSQGQTAKENEREREREREKQRAKHTYRVRGAEGEIERAREGERQRSRDRTSMDPYRAFNCEPIIKIGAVQGRSCIAMVLHSFHWHIQHAHVSEVSV